MWRMSLHFNWRRSANAKPCHKSAVMDGWLRLPPIRLRQLCSGPFASAVVFGRKKRGSRDRGMNENSQRFYYFFLRSTFCETYRYSIVRVSSGEELAVTPTSAHQLWSRRWTRDRRNTEQSGLRRERWALVTTVDKIKMEYRSWSEWEGYFRLPLSSLVHFRYLLRRRSR